MPARLFGALAAVAAVLAALPVHAQHQGHGHAPGAVSDGHLKAQACADEFEVAANQQGYPGPMHVLELKDRLGLEAAQETRIRALEARWPGR
jgi:hypothetical protein